MLMANPIKGPTTNHDGLVPLVILKGRFTLHFFLVRLSCCMKTFIAFSLFTKTHTHKKEKIRKKWGKVAMKAG